MNREYRKGSKYIIACGIFLSLLIVVTILLVLFIPHNLATIVPDINTITKDEVISIEIIIREPENTEGATYTYIAADTRIGEYIDLIKRTKVRKVFNNADANDSQCEVRINMIDGTRKTISLNGNLISGTQYQIITQWNKIFFSSSDTDIDFSGKGSNSVINEKLHSNVEGITVLTNKVSFDQYIDKLNSKDDDSQRLKNFYYETYGDAYFESKSIIMVNYKSSHGEKSIGIDSLQKSGTTLNVVINLETNISNAVTTEKHKLFLLEVNTSDITSFSAYQMHIRNFYQS